MRKYVSFIRDLLQTNLISPQTKDVLNNRLKELDEEYEPKFFNAHLFDILTAVSNRLIPQSNNEDYIDLAASVDRRLAEGKNDGWRYAFMPQDGDSYQIGLTEIDESSKKRYGKTFIELEVAQQDNLLSDVQQAKVSDNGWDRISPHHFFQELLAELTEAYYSHPLAQEEIGYVGMADTHGWKAVRLNHLEAHEPYENNGNNKR